MALSLSELDTRIFSLKLIDGHPYIAIQEDNLTDYHGGARRRNPCASTMIRNMKLRNGMPGAK